MDTKHTKITIIDGIISHIEDAQKLAVSMGDIDSYVMEDIANLFTFLKLVNHERFADALAMLNNPENNLPRGVGFEIELDSLASTNK